ncbi:MAG: amidase family protein [Nocardioides sp.]|uniref:amidase n=1 Tax=Nocardioides sp. TaxID=35761 RepID=UPI0032640AB0
MSDEIVWMPGYELAARIRDRDLSPVEVAQAVLAQLEKVEPSLNAFVTVVPELALEEARRAEKAVISLPVDKLPKLHGVPMTVKDLSETAGVRTTYGAVAYKDHVPDHDDIGVGRLRAAGAVLIGKTTTPEHGMLGITESALTGITNNPWAVTHTSGGSSGGAAASVAAGVAPFAWGSDGGGSIRVPAACCGVVGLKASPGRIPLGRGFDLVGVVGPLTRNVRDAALLLDVTAGPHARDAISLPPYPGSFEAVTIGASVAGLRFAYSPDFGTAEVDREVLAVVAAALRDLEGAGAHVDVVDIDLPDPIDFFEQFWAPAFAAHLAEQTPDGALGDTPLHPVMRELAEIGKNLTALGAYRAATETKSQILDGFLSALEGHDLVISPTMPVTAFPHPGPEAGPTHVNGIPVRRPMLDFHRLTEPPSHASLPAITVNCGFTAEGLPVGLQIIGPLRADAAVLAAAAGFEAITTWSQRRPPLS